MAAALLELIVSIEATDSSRINDDFAVSLLEQVARALQGLNVERQAELVAISVRLAAEERDSRRADVSRALPEGLGIAARAP